MQDTETKKSHPYADRLQENLATQRRMAGLLESKVTLLKEITEREVKLDSFLDKTQEEQLKDIDYHIQLIKTQGELDVLNKIINEKDNYYKEYMVQFEKDMAEIALKFDNTIAIARKSTKPNIVKLLTEIQWDKVDNDDEVKIAVYKQLRKHV